MMKRLLLVLSTLLSGYGSGFAESLSYHDVQLCTNAYNHFWSSFETIKSNLKGDPAAQLLEFIEEFNKVVTPDFHFEVQNLPVPPDYTSTLSIVVNGISDLANTAAFGTDDFGEHHIASPFSVKILPSTEADASRVYSMTTRDIAYTANVSTEGGCTVYLSQKDILCTVKKIKSISNGKKALLSSIIDNVVTAYTLPAPQCALWNAAPVTPYV